MQALVGYVVFETVFIQILIHQLYALLFAVKGTNMHYLHAEPLVHGYKFSG